MVGGAHRTPRRDWGRRLCHPTVALLPQEAVTRAQMVTFLALGNRHHRNTPALIPSLLEGSRPTRFTTARSSWLPPSPANPAPLGRVSLTRKAGLQSGPVTPPRSWPGSRELYRLVGSWLCWLAFWGRTLGCFRPKPFERESCDDVLEARLPGCPPGGGIGGPFRRWCLWIAPGKDVWVVYCHPAAE